MRRLFFALVVVTVAFSFGLLVKDARASRNSSGTYSLPAGNPAVPNTLITSSQWNSNFSDLGNEVSDSLSRSGKGGMNVPLQNVDGVLAAPGYTFSSEPSTGDYKAAAGSECRGALGTQLQCWTKQTTAVTRGVWAVATLYNAADTVQNAGFVFNCSVGGTSAAAGGGPTPSSLTDNTVTWTLVGAATSSSFPAAVTFNGGGKTVFNGSATDGALTLAPEATPSAPANGQIWVDSTTNHFAARVNGSTVNFATTPIARPDMPVVGQQVSGSSGAFCSSSAGTVNVTNLAVTLTTTGRPVVVVMQPDNGGAGFAAFLGSNNAAVLQVARTGTSTATYQWYASTTTPANFSNGPPGFFILDVVAAGTYTYTVQVQPGGAALCVERFAMAAYEL